MGWASDDDYDDSISIWETVPAEKVPEKNIATSDRFDPRANLERSTWEPMDDSGGNDQSYGQITLKLDVKSIQVFRIGGVSYQTSRRSVMRYRRPANQKTPF
jgi:uncharacterized protein (DUF4415 family)